jgi:hypothetical protein
MSSMYVHWACWAFTNLATLLQTELAIDTNLVVTDTRVVVADTQVVVTDTQVAVADTRAAVVDAHKAIAGTHTVVADTHTMIADIHRSVLTGREGTSNKNNSVSVSQHPPTKRLPSPRPVNRHPQPRGTFSVVTN